MDKTINQNLIVKGSVTADIVLTQKKDEPIGSIIMGTGDNFATQEAVQAVYIGTWEQIKDVFLLAAGDFYAAGSTGGEATHTLTVAELAKHSHDIITDGAGKYVGFNDGNASPDYVRNDYTDTSNIGNQYVTTEVGGNQAHNNMPPYLTVYMWRRTA